MTKEKKPPKHIEKKETKHPGSHTRLIEISENIPNPRGPSCNFKHPLPTVLFITENRGHGVITGSGLTF